MHNTADIYMCDTAVLPTYNSEGWEKLLIVEYAYAIFIGGDIWQSSSER